MYKYFHRYIPIAVAVVAAVTLVGCGQKHNNAMAVETMYQQKQFAIDVNNLPKYSGSPYVVINNNVPFIDMADAMKGNFETYSDLDGFGRCGVAYVNACKELMPTEKRGPIGQVKPSGWQTKRYDDLIEGKYLYNRCHLVAFQIAGENANEKNLITGTRYLNTQGMLPFENMVAAYIKKTGNHVLYRVTPAFVGDELVARGVFMEAISVEDNGKGICFNVYCYNIQPYVNINYNDGTSERVKM